MPDVEEGCLFAGPFMGFADAEVGVLDWHGVAGERDHFAAMADVEIVEASAV